LSRVITTVFVFGTFSFFSSYFFFFLLTVRGFLFVEAFRFGGVFSLLRALVREYSNFSSPRSSFSITLAARPPLYPKRSAFFCFRGTSCWCGAPFESPLSTIVRISFSYTLIPSPFLLVLKFLFTAPSRVYSSKKRAPPNPPPVLMDSLCQSSSPVFTTGL